MDSAEEKRYRDMLHAYELGLLTDEERVEFELHVLECDSCRQELLDFRETIRLINHDTEIRATVERIAGPSEPNDLRTGRWWAWKRLVPILAAAAALMFLIIKPWQIEISSDSEAIAARNRLAILPFENISDPTDSDRLSDIAANLLITDLSESSYLQVISDQRLYDILKLMGKDTFTVIDRNTASEVAAKADARWMLLGSIMTDEPHLVLTSRLVDVGTGDVVASQRISGSVEDNIFILVDRLSAEVKKDMMLPAVALEEPDPMVAKVTTGSEEAYRWYLEGLEANNKYYFIDAARAFQKSLEYDSTLAMSYYHLSMLIRSDYINQALSYIDNVGRKEKYYILSRKANLDGDRDAAISILEEMLRIYPDEKMAHFRLGNLAFFNRQYEKAVTSFKRTLDIDPMYSTAYNMLAYSYQRLEDFDRALEYINKYIELEPGEPNPYDSRGDIYFKQGKYDLAIESYRTALRKKPDFYTSLINMGCIFAMQHDFVRAESCFTALTQIPGRNLKISGRLYLAYLPMCQGKYKEALAILDWAVTSLLSESDEHEHPSFHALKAVVYRELGQYEKAVEESGKAIEISDKNNPEEKIYERKSYIRYLAESGNIKKADILAEELKQTLDSIGADLNGYYYARGCIERSRGRLDEAIDYLKKSVENSSTYYIVHDFMLARTCLETSRYERAEGIFRHIADMSGQCMLSFGYLQTKAYYYLGLVYENTEKYESAAEAYRTFLDTWRNADDDSDELADARRRLTALENRL